MKRKALINTALALASLFAVPSFAAAFEGAAFGALSRSAAAYGYDTAFAVPAPSGAACGDDCRLPESGLQLRLRSASSRFLGIPYVLGPLGEGDYGEFDRDPLFSVSGLDCTTFVEQTMAFALGREDAEAMDILRRIRYKDGVIAYEARNHFTEADWLPNNIAAGFLRDITAEVAGGMTRSETKTVSKRAWYRAKSEAELKGFDYESPAERAARLERLRSLGGNMPDTTHTLRYVPLERLLDLLPRIPSGTVASVVREARADKPTMVTHQLMIFDGPRGKVIRHASSGNAVVEVDAAAYISGLSGASWRILGLNLSQVTE